MKVHIDSTFTSVEGCRIQIVGDLDVSVSFWGDVTINGFSGTVTISGGGDCPNGTLSFGLAPSGGTSGEDINIVLDSRNLSGVSNVTWTKGTKPVPKILNEKIVSDSIIKEFKRIAKELKYCEGEANINVTVTVNYNGKKCY